MIDDVHELGSDEARRQLELLVMRAPPELRFVLATRHDVRLGLHRLRLEGELTEIRADDLRFSLAEARELFAAAGVELAEPALAMLVERTEGWAAGLRLAALSLAGHPDPERFAAEFSGSERTVAEYLLAEVLDRQTEEVRRLLLRTSVLERVNGELADLLTGDSGGERVLQDLEQANAFVVSLDAARSWFRYHQLFADLLQLELRRTEPGEVAALHELAAGWLAGHGFPVEAIRHAQAARDWGLAARLLADHWPGLHLDGQAATVHELLAGFPAEPAAADAELAALAAADELAQGSLEAAERYLGLAERGSASVPDRPARAGAGAARGGPAAAGPAAREPAGGGRGGAAAAGPGRSPGRGAARPGRGAARAGADQPRRHRVLGEPGSRRRSGTWSRASRWHAGSGGRISSSAAWRTRRRSRSTRSLAAGGGAQQAGGRAGRTARLDRRAGRRRRLLGARSRAGLAGAARGGRALGPARRAHRQGGSRARGGGMVVHQLRGLLELARGRDADALAAFRAAERLAGHLAAPHLLVPPTRALLLLTLVRLGETERAEQVLADLGEQDRERGEMRIATAALRLAQDDPHAATAALAPVLDGSAPVHWRTWLVEAFVLEAIARDALGDPAAAGHALERALDLAEPDGALLWFLLHPRRACSSATPGSAPRTPP